MKYYCGLCGNSVIHYSVGEPIDWKEYDRYGRERITGKSVEFNRLPEKVRNALKQKKSGIEDDSPICPRCYSKILDEIWVSERAVCKNCDVPLDDIGWSLEQPCGHSIMSTQLMGCPECRIVYFIPYRHLTNSSNDRI